METSSTSLPQLSSYLPTSSSDTRASSTTATGINSSMGIKKRRNSIEGAFLAVSPSLPTPHHLENEQLKRKHTSLEVSVDVEDKGSKAMPFSRLSSIYHAQEQGSPLVISKGFSFSSTTSSQDGDIANVETTSYFASQPATPVASAPPEIITRIDAGEKQVALAREFSVSRAAICNLYKNRWEVLTRGILNSESKHPKSKRSRSKRSSPQLTPQPAASDESSTAAPEPITVYPDVSTISIDTKESPCDNKDASRVEGSVRRPREELRRHSSLSSVAAETDSTQRDRSKPRHQMGHHQPSPDRRSSFEEVASSPVTSRPFLVHEASAYSYPCRNLIAALRDESISTSVFQQRATRLVRLLIEEALTCLPHEHVQIKNQFGDVCHATKSLDERDICGVSMEDKGMVLLRAFSTISPTSPTGVVSIHARTSDDKNRDDGMWASIHAQLPPVSSRQACYFLTSSVLQETTHMQISAKSIYFVTVISSFEGLQTVFRHFPDVTLIVAQVDTVLDADQRIRPGIGDFMQRFWNVHSDPSTL
ncbi:Phosphoribosyltransferase-like [Phytophthora cactorum]|nr:Phosphoribosyltransferase-like [Phytophthora cactorum]